MEETAYEEHRRRMAEIRSNLAGSKITLEEAAQAEVEELDRFTKALRDAV